MVDIDEDRARFNKRRREICNKYEKTLRGYVMRMYRNMKSRIEGVQKAKSHLYFGKFLLSKEGFYNIAMSSNELYELFKQYEKSGYVRALSPSVDRIDSRIGYTEENIQFITHRDNSQKSSEKPVRINGEKFCSLKNAANSFGISRTTLRSYLRDGVVEGNRFGIVEVGYE